ncbi:shikimate kinase [Microbacterium sp. C7(2022)]|uniref:shikimate kinase n=1 Tax=Microbacterium sp. C7(2022) TaxID=2992759 RepID=UPI00237A69C3|nr:shikimate kinase [Microbacterium sp. C7(2022)]MDE0545541.1 shikimate kinase [Microbacterium sp. C7(2022)]
MTSDALVLIGPMGAGKTSIGKRVAKALGTTFTDTDSLVVREHGAIADLFASGGEELFRRLERLAVADALSAGGVIALGGGAVLNRDTQRDLGDHRVVLLTVSDDVIAGRIGGSSRPLLREGDAVEQWKKIAHARAPLYESLADITFDTSRGPLSAVADAVVEWARSSDSHTEDS